MRDYGEPRPGALPSAWSIISIARIDATLEERRTIRSFRPRRGRSWPRSRPWSLPSRLNCWPSTPLELISSNRRPLSSPQSHSTAASAAVLVVATGIRRGGPTIWRQPDLAPHLRRADDFVAEAGQPPGGRVPQAFNVGDPTADFDLQIHVAPAIAGQDLTYGIMTLIESAEGWDAEDALLVANSA